MKLKPLSSLDRDRLFYLDKIIASEYDLEMHASTRNNELSIRIFIDDLIHFQITNESYKVKFMEDMFENEKRKNSLHYFFEITDGNYMDWLVEESFGFFQKEYYKAYVFFFDDSVVEVVSADDSVIEVEVVSADESVCSRIVIGKSGGNPILEKAQNNAVQTRTLSDGRIRYYDAERPARTEGPTRGNSFVTEYNPKTGQTRQWMESYDHSGNVTRVHLQSIDGQKGTGSMEKITTKAAYFELIKLFEQNASDEKISDKAFDFLYSWSEINSPESRNIIYDLALVGESGMELTREEIRELIDKLNET